MPTTTASSIGSKMVGTAIRSARIRAGLTQAEVARQLGTAPSYVAKVELGGANLTVGQLVNFANAMGVGVDVQFPEVSAEFRSLPRPAAAV